MSRRFETAAREVLLQRRRALLWELDEIQSALERIEAEMFGTCQHCGHDIDLGRLEAIPWTRLCHACSRAADAPQPNHA